MAAQGTATINGSVNINTVGVTLQNTRITGDLVLGEGIGSGDVTLNNVVVLGNTVVKGGGSHSVTLNNCTLPSLTVSKDGVRIVASGSTSVTLVRLDSGATLVETNTTGPGFETITMSSVIPPGAQIILTGNFDAVSVESDNINISISGGTITKLDVAAEAAGTGIDIASGTTVGTLTLNAAVNVTGQGTVTDVIANVSGATFAGTVTVGSTTGGGGTVQTITISNISAANTLGKVRFDTDRVVTASDLTGKVFADGVALTNIQQRGTGTPGEVWNGMIPSPTNDHNYTITFSSPFVISGGNTVGWSSQTAAPPVTGVEVDLNTSSPSGNGSDITVSFTEPSGAKTMISSYRIIVVSAASFNLAATNGVAPGNYTVVNKSSGTVTMILSSGARNTSGATVTTGVSYRVFVLSICDGTNATVNALSSPSSTFTLSGGGGGGSGDDGHAAPTFSSASTSADGNKIIVVFSKAMAALPVAPAGFAVTVKGTDDSITAVALDADPSKIDLTLATPITSYSDAVQVSYTAGTVQAADGGKLASFTAQGVTNNVPAPPVFVSAEVTTSGDVSVTFDKDMANPAGSQLQFAVKVNDVDIVTGVSGHQYCK